MLLSSVDFGSIVLSVLYYPKLTLISSWAISEYFGKAKKLSFNIHVLQFITGSQISKWTS